MVTLTKSETDLEASLPKAGAMAAVKSGSPVMKIIDYYYYYYYHISLFKSSGS